MGTCPAIPAAPVPATEAAETAPFSPSVTAARHRERLLQVGIAALAQRRRAHGHGDMRVDRAISIILPVGRPNGLGASTPLG